MPRKAIKKTSETNDGQESGFVPQPSITFKGIGVSGRDAVEAQKPVFMCRLFGEITGFKQREGGKFGLYTYFLGEFRVTTNSGAKFQSHKLFLPSAMSDEMIASLTAADGKPIKFAYDIVSVPTDQFVIGYQYGYKSLIQTEVANRILELEKELDGMKLPK
jgi:hypothetical protein